MNRKIRRVRQVLDPSAEALLAEHDRIASLHLFNAEMGEKRIATYLTIVSIAVGALISITQLRLNVDALLELSAGILVGITALGVLTFVRLIERRANAVEYLRAINRIHAYFIYQDPSLEQFFSWPPCDDVPAFGSTKLLDFTGLRDVIAVLNSIFAAMLSGLLLFMMLFTLGWLLNLQYLLPILLGLLAFGVVLLLHHRFEKNELLKAEVKANVEVRFSSTDHIKVPGAYKTNSLQN